MLRPTVPKLVAALLVLALVLPASAAQETAKNFQVLSINPGLGARMRAGFFFPVAVELGVLATPVSGTISISTESTAESTPVYAIPFEVLQGASYRYYLYPYCQAATDKFLLTIRDSRGRILWEESLSMRSHDTDAYFVASIGQEGVAGFSQRDPDEKMLGFDAAPVQMAYMPPRACGWDLADTVIWPHPDPTGLDPGQESSLRQWVIGGGRLILGLGSTWEPATKTFLSEFLPGKVTGIETTAELASLAAFCDEPMDAEAEMVIATVERPDGDVMLYADDTPLVVRFRVGFGEVIVLAFDPTKRPFARWRGAAPFWDRLFALKRLPIEENQEYGGHYGYNAGAKSVIARALAVFPDVKPISFTFVVIFLFVYVLLIGPVDYFLLKKLKHLEWTWFTFPAIAVAATLIAFWTISSTRAASIYINQLEIRDYSADGKGARTSRLAVLLSPTNHRYDVSFGSACDDMYLFETDDGTYYRGGGFNLSQDFFMTSRPDSGPVASDLLVPVWSTRTFCGVSRHDPEADNPFTAQLYMDGNTLAGTIVNTSSEGFSDVTLIHKSGVYNLGRLDSTGSFNVGGKNAQKLGQFYEGLKSKMESASHMQHNQRDRRGCREGARFAALGWDARYFPAEHYKNVSMSGYGYGGYGRYDLPPEWSLRAPIEDGQAVILAETDRALSPLDVGPGGTTRWEKVVHRVCVNVD